MAASFFFGYLRIYTGSTWPASIAHAVHNAAWNILGAFTLITASPVLVNVYLVGDFGLLILIGTVIGAIWVGHRFKSGMDEAQSGSRGRPGSTRRPPQPRRLRGRHTRSKLKLTPTINGTAFRAGTPFLSCEGPLFTEVPGRGISRKSISSLLQGAPGRID